MFFLWMFLNRFLWKFFCSTHNSSFCFFFYVRGAQFFLLFIFCKQLIPFLELFLNDLKLSHKYTFLILCDNDFSNFIVIKQICTCLSFHCTQNPIHWQSCCHEFLECSWLENSFLDHHNRIHEAFVSDLICIFWLHISITIEFPNFK